LSDENKIEVDVEDKLIKLWWI